MEKLPEEFNMVEIMAKVPPEERTPYVVVAFQETERMNMLTGEMRRTLKELDLGLKVRSVYCCGLFPLPDSDSNSDSGTNSCTMQDFSFALDLDSDPAIEMYVIVT